MWRIDFAELRRKVFEFLPKRKFASGRTPGKFFRVVESSSCKSQFCEKRKINAEITSVGMKKWSERGKITSAAKEKRILNVHGNSSHVYDLNNTQYPPQLLLSSAHYRQQKNKTGRKCRRSEGKIIKNRSVRECEVSKANCKNRNFVCARKFINKTESSSYRFLASHRKLPGEERRKFWKIL